MNPHVTSAVIMSREHLKPDPRFLNLKKEEDEGGCGVIGVISTIPIEGKYIITPCTQMRNRGNGKGGGIAAAGIFPKYRDKFAIQIAYIVPDIRKEVEKKYINENFDLTEVQEQLTIDDYRDAGLSIRPPDVVRYFARVKRDILDKFISQTGINDEMKAEEEFIYRNSFSLNREFYGSGDVKAFILSHGRDLMILKGVGYAEEICTYYCLNDMKAHIWIGHQRYPTRGRVWHPGGAHPFTGLNEALVHNGDFANYYAVTEYLKQKNIYPLFITDTEVSVLLFDLYTRVYGYPLEFTIEALAPTSERDFEMLPKMKQRIYRAIRNSHIHGSPDGPWFFIIARTEPLTRNMQLIGITDTSMLRPQVFAFMDGENMKVGAIASEKQAIDSFLENLSKDYSGNYTIADKYWNARGGSHSDGGAFIYTLEDTVMGKKLCIEDKFGNRLFTEKSMKLERTESFNASMHLEKEKTYIPVMETYLKNYDLIASGNELISILKDMNGKDLDDFVKNGVSLGKARKNILGIVKLFTFLYNRRYLTLNIKRSLFTGELIQSINEIFAACPSFDDTKDSRLRGVIWGTRNKIRRPESKETTLVIDCNGFPPEGENSVARFLVNAYNLGWKQFILYRCKGDRFIGAGLGPKSDDVRIDVYGSSGDYLGSGLDGAHIYVHGNAQDQVGQILKSGKLVIYGDVGQTFLYGAKGGTAYVLGNAAGRPLINSVGKVRAIINGTCLDYCAESFMAGDTIDGGFVIINGVEFDERGEVIGLESKYPGSNFFSLASGGSGYISDPYYTMGNEQLNGGRFVDFTQEDWLVILPYLIENENLFGIRIRRDLLTVDGVIMWPKEVFRKVVASEKHDELDWSSLPE
jgi:glutamate synthase domain-containing protein 1/glutamate synthase domain-containing protein 3